jgi:hypothetical protein
VGPAEDNGWRRRTDKGRERKQNVFTDVYWCEVSINPQRHIIIIVIGMVIIGAFEECSRTRSDEACLFLSLSVSIARIR